MTDRSELIARLRGHADADDGGLLVDDLHEAADALARREGADELEGAFNYADDLAQQLSAARQLLAEAADALEAAEREKDELKRALAVEGRQAGSADRIMLGLQRQRDELMRERDETRKKLVVISKLLVDSLEIIIDSVDGVGRARAFLDRVAKLKP